MSLRDALIVAAVAYSAVGAAADELLYRYEGDVVPYDESAGWMIYDPCDPPCTESVRDGDFVLDWAYVGDLANYAYRIAEPPDDPPPTLWVEWRFRSNHPIPPHSYTCDGRFSLKYGGTLEVVFMYGDAVVSGSASHFVLGLALDEFHTYRYESLDGINYRVSVDGEVFIIDADDSGNGYHTLQFSGGGGCLDDWIPDMHNHWDFVRFGTISYGEPIAASDPPSGFLDSDDYGELDRFAVTFDSPNYVYIDDITVQVSGGEVPVVTQTWRRDNDGPETLEIVLDRPIPMGERTAFIIDDGVITNVVQYTFVRGDADADGRIDLADFAAFQNCFAQSPVPSSCRAFGFNSDDQIDLTDFAGFQNVLSDP